MKPQFASKIDLQHTNRVNIDVTSCICCGQRNGIERHRIIPGRIGGAYSNENTCALCDRCHKLAHKLIRLMQKQHGFVEYENIIKMVKSYLEQEN